MFRLIGDDPPAGQVRRITFVPFLPDGRCVLVEGPGGPGLPVGEVLDGQDDLNDAALRIPLQTAGFRYQHFRPFGLDGDHLYAWIEGGPYAGSRPHGPAKLSFGPAEQAARRLDYVHVLLDCVPWPRRADLVRHHLESTVQPGTGRLLVGYYSADPMVGIPDAAETLRSLGFACAGRSSGGNRPGRAPVPTAWINAGPVPRG